MPRRRPAATRIRDAPCPLISLLPTLIVVGVLLRHVNTYLAVDGKIRQILNSVVVIATVLWVLSVFGLFSRLGNVHVARS